MQILLKEEIIGDRFLLVQLSHSNDGTGWCQEDLQRKYLEQLSNSFCNIFYSCGHDNISTFYSDLISWLSLNDLYSSGVQGASSPFILCSIELKTL